MVSLLKRHYVRTKPYPEKKIRAIEEASELLRKYRYVFVIDIHGVSNRILKEYRLKLRRIDSVMKHIKNTLFRLAIEKTFGKVSEDIEKILTGENMFIFTNMNPIEFVQWIEENAVRREAKPGDKAPYEIVIPAGDTGLSPGPILSKFGKLRVPTRVQGGKIWVVKDTVVAKPGDTISPELAEILQKLKIRPIFESLKVKAIIVEGRRVITSEELLKTFEEVKTLIPDAAKYAVNLAVNAELFIPEIMPILIQKACIYARNLAINANIVIPETANIVIAKAIAQAYALAGILSQKAPELGLQVQTVITTTTTTPAPAEVKPVEEKKEEKKEEEKKEGPSEEEIASGLASLFG